MGPGEHWDHFAADLACAGTEVDHVRGAEDYNYYLDEYVRAEEVSST